MSARPFPFACVRHDAQRHDLALDNWLAKATQEVTCRVKVLVEALMARTPSRTARVSVARRNLKEAAGKLPARGTRTAYEASSWWASILLKKLLPATPV